jgi:hypothetical protein
VEVLLQRHGEPISGWLGYTFGKTRREAYGFSFPFDFDRPHTLSLVANARLSARLRFSTTLLAASGFPITPLHNEVFFSPGRGPDGTPDPIVRPSRNPDGSFRLSPEPTMRRLSLRNSDCLNPYARVDVRVTYSTLGRWEVYGEVINLLGSRNYLQTMPVPPLAGGFAGTTTANNVYETFERFPSFGGASDSRRDGARTVSDLELVRRMLAGDETAFDRCFQMAYPALYRFALVRLGFDRDAAAEIVEGRFCGGWGWPSVWHFS